jgi:hypothetical protein
MNAPANSIEEGTVTPLWTHSLILGVFVAKAPLTDATLLLEPPKRVLTVLVRDLTGTDSAIRNIARAEAIRILNKAGIELLWIDANGSEDPQLASVTKSYVTVVIAKQPPIGWTKTDAMGFAPARTGPT